MDYLDEIINLGCVKIDAISRRKLDRKIKDFKALFDNAAFELDYNESFLKKTCNICVTGKRRNELEVPCYKLKQLNTFGKRVRISILVIISGVATYSLFIWIIFKIAYG